MTEPELEALYHRYIDCLNERRFGELGEFVHERLTYNGESMTAIDYGNLIARHAAAIPDLHFHVKLLVADGSQVACRLVFNCTPQSEFLGLQPNGRTILFAEHVFYKFRGGKIAEVWSLLDRSAVEAQFNA